MSNSSADQAAFTNLQQRLKALDRVIQGICKVAGAPGISFAASHHGDAIYRGSFGFSDLETKKPVTGSTQFAIGTMAKTFTASAVCALVAEGKLEWDTPIKSILPELQTASPTVTENLTIVDLLSHRAGLGRSNMWWQGANATLLLEKNDLLPAYNSLPVTGPFRGEWAYSNWGYALAGEVIERVSGKTYAQYLQETVNKRLGLKNTTVEPVDASVASDLARPYAALSDASGVSLHPIPQPPISGNTIMAAALGGVSSADDLLKYSIALLQAFRHETGIQTSDPPPALKHALMHLSGHIFTSKALLEKSYAFGWYRTQLPNTVLGMGWNSIYVKEMPQIVPKGYVGPLIAHGGSLPGYHVAIALLPHIDSSVVVCTNSIALGDVSGWVSMALIEALVDTPEPSDYLALATEAAANAAINVESLERKLDAARMSGTTPRANDEYIGRYRDEKRGWLVDVRAKLSSPFGLEVVFQGLDSQAWTLSHYEHDTFLWLATREEQAKRGRMVTYPLSPDHFKLIFQASRGGKIDRLLWKHEAGAPLDQQYLVKE
ncbi:hypothetical protein G7Y89_g8284 [Cudoniella acicularis]|uniref:Beta-lactamase-related domain-containing protein n=1 Tax=Cudoniella acicularis TaxID=354080 RepID=A0A8H4RGW8_9HELO|nr:hypothetical protein G7Y89_g8284 [Cudoniella acicularis]